MCIATVALAGQLFAASSALEHEYLARRDALPPLTNQLYLLYARTLASSFATQNVAAAQVDLGNMYLTGEGEPQDDSLAFAWYLAAASNNYPAAQAEVGRRYNLGISVSQNFEQALFWLTKAVSNQSLEALHTLGYMHLHGNGVPENRSYALACISAAAVQGYNLSQFTLGEWFSRGYVLHYSPRQGLYWYYQAASQEYAQAQYAIGRAREHGSHAVYKPELALHWYRNAASNGYGNAQVTMGSLYQKGRLVPQNLSAAFSWFLMAAQQDYPRAQYMVAQFYDEGTGVKKNMDNALYWYHRSSSNGFAFSSFVLGGKYYLGQGVPLDFGIAAENFRRVTRNSNADSFLQFMSWILLGCIDLAEGNFADANLAFKQTMEYSYFSKVVIIAAVIIIVSFAVSLSILLLAYYLRRKFKKRPRTSWGILDALLIFYLLLASFIAGNFLSLLSIISDVFIIRAIVLTVLLNVFVIVVGVIIARRRGWHILHSFGATPVPVSKLLLWSVLCPIIVIVFGIAYEYGLGLFDITPKIQWLVQQVLNLDTLRQKQFFVLVGGVIVPVLEELIFRGIIYQGIRSRTPAIVAALITSIAFTLVHLEPWSFPPIFLMSMLLCYAMEKTRNIGVPIAIHSINNLFSIAVFFVFGL